MTLRKKLIRLAYHKPHLRPHLLPILKEAGYGCEKNAGGYGGDCGCGDSGDVDINVFGEDLEASRRFDPLKSKNNKNYGPPYKEDKGKWEPKNRGKGKCYYETGNEADRCYVTTKGGPGGKKKKKTGPAGKPKSKQRKEYNKNYVKQRWPEGNR